MTDRPPLADTIKALGFDSTYIEALEEVKAWRPVRCPFHDDAHASATASITRAAFACHACGVRGDSWSLILQFQHIPKEEFHRAVTWAADNVGYESARVRTTARESYRSSWAADLSCRARYNQP